MSDVFDPYRQWLGIWDPRRPPHHYLLLGARPFEEDLNVLFNLAERQMAHVRSFLGSPQSAAAQRVLQEIAAAQQCLTNRQRKAEYDARLRTELCVSGAAQGVSAGRPPPRTPPLQVPPPSGVRYAVPLPPAPPPLTAPPTAETPSSAPAAKPGDSSVVAWTVTLVTFAVLVLAGVYALRTGQGRRPAAPEVPPVVEQGTPATREALSSAAARLDVPAAPPKQATAGASTPTSPAQRPPSAPAGIAAAPPAPTPSPSAAMTAAVPSRALPPPATTTPQAAAAPPKTASVAVPSASSSSSPTALSLAAARTAMRTRNFALAQRHLEAAQRSATAGDAAQIAQLRTVLGHLTGFWKQVQTAASALSPGRMLLLPGGIATVESAQSDQIAYQQGDKSFQYTLTTLPLETALAILASGPRDANSDPSGETAVQIIDPQGDRVRAAELCDALKKRGAPAQELLAELQQQATPRQPTATAVAAAPVAAAAQSGVAPPSAAEQKKAREEIRKVFAKEFAAAENVDAKRRLCETLLTHAIETTDDRAAQFGLLAEARDMALDAADAALFSYVADLTVERFAVDRLLLQTESMQQALRRMRVATAWPPLAAIAMELAKAALAAERIREAETLIDACKEYARRFHDTPRLKAAVALGRDLEAAKQTRVNASLAERTLTAKPDDPAAHLTLGKYLCFVKGDWSAGLPHLAKGSDQRLAKLAAAEAAAPPQATDQAALGDLWWDRAANVDEDLAQALRKRALHWYNAALPGLTGLTKFRIERRIQESGEGTRKQ